MRKKQKELSCRESNINATDESQARIDGSILKDHARLDSAVNEGDAKVENNRDISGTRITVTQTSGQIKLESSEQVHDAKLRNVNREADADIVNIIAARIKWIR